MMRRKIGGYTAGTGAFLLVTTGCCLDSPAWKAVLVLVIVSVVMIAVGIRMMQIPEALREKGFRYESRITRDRKAENRKETFRTWKTTW